MVPFITPLQVRRSASLIPGSVDSLAGSGPASRNLCIPLAGSLLKHMLE